MSVAKIVEVTAESTEGFEDAVRQGVEKASETIHNIKGAWVKEQKVMVENGTVIGYRVVLKVTFIID